MSRCSRRTQCGYGVFYASLVEHQHVGIALDDEGCALPPHRFGDLRKAVEQVPLVEDIRLRRVQVLGLGVAQGPRPETDDPAAPVGDWEGDPTRETLPTARREQPRRIQGFPVEIEPSCYRKKPRRTSRRGIPQKEFFYSRTLHLAIFEVLSGVLCFGGLGGKEVLVIVNGCGGEGPGSLNPPQGAVPGCVWVSPALELQVNTRALGDVRDRICEIEGLEIHNELDSVPSALAVVGGTHLGQEGVGARGGDVYDRRGHFG